MNVHVLRGLLGWSNKRNGLEFYRWDDKVIPRFGSEWGDLLAADKSLGDAEGRPVIVAVLPRSAKADEVDKVLRAVEKAIHEVEASVKA